MEARVRGLPFFTPFTESTLFPCSRRAAPHPSTLGSGALHGGRHLPFQSFPAHEANVALVSRSQCVHSTPPGYPDLNVVGIRIRVK